MKKGVHYKLIVPRLGELPLHLRCCEFTVRRVADIEHNGVARCNAVLIARLTLVPA